MRRRTILAFGATLAAAPRALTATARADGVSEIRIGYQKNGVFLVAKQQQLLEHRFAPRGIAVRWAEFTFGPPLLEALQAGSLDYGTTGDTPPIFAQAARANLLYAAALPARGAGQAIVVLPDSPIAKLPDLRGKRVGVARASSAHNLLVAALEADGVAFADITPVYLAPPDAAAAFAKRAIDAWSIWDPFYAIAELSHQGARALPIRPAAQAQNSFFLANRPFAEHHPDLVAAINDELTRASAWIDAHRDEAAHQFAEASGVSYEAQKRSVGRAEFNFTPMTDDVIAQQQAVADRFFHLGLIPRQVHVRDIVWTGKSAA
jgi:aliphatic sulfonates family ABC transporter substrate-binding protein